MRASPFRSRSMVDRLRKAAPDPFSAYHEIAPGSLSLIRSIAQRNVRKNMAHPPKIRIFPDGGRLQNFLRNLASLCLLLPSPDCI